MTEVPTGIHDSGQHGENKDAEQSASFLHTGRAQPMGSAAVTRPPVSQGDVARLAGVSQKTVSRVVNGAGDVHEATRLAVQRAIDQLGYRPNVAARTLVSRRSQLIGVATVSEPVYTTFSNIIGVERAARHAGYATVVSTTSDPLGGVAQAVEELLEHGVDGVIVSEPVDFAEWDPGIVGTTPLVSIRSHDAGDRIAVGYDQAAAAEIATQHLLDLGHRTVWHVAAGHSSRIASGRRAGWERTLRRAGREIPQVVTGSATGARGGFEAGSRLLPDADVTAVFAINDLVAYGLLRAAFALGRKVPEDLSIVGFADLPEAEFQVVPLTTVREDPMLLAARAVHELLAVIEGGDRTPKKVELPLELVIRDSTAPPPAR